MPDLISFQLLLATFAGWVNREQANVIGYLREENRVKRGRRVDRLEEPVAATAS